MVELLSPAGSFDSFLGALNAGADAVYLGGEKYSARAYADNFTEEQIIKALDIAHFHSKKVYLTLNTLLKDDELDQAIEFVLPFYEHHLDGIIVQDTGLAYQLGRIYPDLPLHASTQMTVTGSHGASLLREKGFTRIVPARELSLNEIEDIKKNTDVELECFIHGAMCYCYSGQCLFSSILGGRSGNRGRCAQPCRLPYSVQLQGMHEKSSEKYPLSMKDLCTIYLLPELMEAGIDSFKIEGRMKHPAYTCGVTALYRKYINLYESSGKENYHVQREDIDMLQKLYIRSDIHDGYYHKHCSKKMITPGKPSYVGADDLLIQNLSEKYIRMPSGYPVGMQIVLEAGEPTRLTIYDHSGIQVKVCGDIPEKAKGRPISEEEIRKQLRKTGNSLLCCETVNVQMTDELFLSVSALNRLRRQAVSLFEEEKRRMEGFAMRKAEELSDDGVVERETQSAVNCDPDTVSGQCGVYQQKQSKQLHVSVMSMEQLEALADTKIDRLYIDSDLWFSEESTVTRCLKEQYSENIELYLMLPYIVRKRDQAYYEHLYDRLSKTDLIRGLLVRNLEQIQMIKLWNQGQRIIRCVGDANIYQMNRFSADFLEGLLDEYTLPYELNFKEQKKICSYSTENERAMTQIVYSRIPMMISANCLKNTVDKCDHVREISDTQYLQDRYKKKFPVYNNCIHCYNVIYNSVPYSLHNKLEQVCKLDVAAYRLDFALENGQEALSICNSYRDALIQDADVLNASVFSKQVEFTTGHFSRGVE